MTAGWRPSRAILELGGEFYDPVSAADFPEARLRYRNDAAAAQIGLESLSDDEWIRHFGRFEPLPGSLDRPLALRYHGHQFRTYNPDIGDGRGFLFAQGLDDRERLMDLGTKGSGQTPYSRFGDGRLTLKGGVRELLATTMLQALGVETSRTFSLIETGEELVRGDEPSPTRSAVLVRLNHSHIRYGSFQRLAALQDEAGMRTLTDYVLRHYFEPSAAPFTALIDHAVTNAATQAAQMMAAGFVHGVLNTDNINIIGEVFDFGPWRFAPSWTRTSPPPISTIRACIPSAASPRRCNGTSTSWRSRSGWSRRPRRCAARLRTIPGATRPLCRGDAAPAWRSAAGRRARRGAARRHGVRG